MGTISAHFLFVRLATALLSSAAVSGQDAWRIPLLGAVEYSRTGEHKASDPMKSAAAAKQAPLSGKWPDRYLPRLPPAPWVCQGELRVDQKAIAGPVRDLRDAMRAVACDLGSRGGGRWKFERLLPFGDVVVSGSWSPPTADGAQTLKGTFAASKIVLQTGEGREVLELFAPFCLVDCSGSVVITRRLDPAQGLVAGWQANCDLVADEGERSYRRIVVDEAQTLVAVRDNQDADFRVRTAAAIRAGTGWVRDAIDEQKSFLVEKGGDERNYGSGRLALGLLTLLHGHVPPDDAVVQRGFTELKKRRLEDSYSLAAALMAIAALHAPAGEAARLREGGLDRIAVHELPEKDRKVAQKWLQQLLSNVDPRGEQIDLLRFNYTAGPRYDTSLQQYGLLGMWSAHGCGLELPKGAFAKAARHLLDVQGRNEGALTLRLCSYAQLRDAAGTELPPKQSEQRAQARGFAYQEATEPAFGSMTSAGLSGLLLARSGMVARDELERSLAPRLEAAVRDSYAWLAENFSVRCNPGFAERGDHHYYYWLYCLERSCELAGIARLQGRDWYYEGGVQLLSHQQANGSFRAEHASTLLLDSTCFAVLFLAKATAAGPITGR